MASDKKGALKRSAKIAFLEASGFSQKPSVRRTWAPRGKTPHIDIHFNWKRLKVIGSLVCEPEGEQADLLLHMQDKTIKEDAIVDYLQALHKQVPGPIVLLWDHLSAHTGKKVATYLTANQDWLTVEWFPGYAPELNPVEYVWSYAKDKPTANSSPDTLGEIEDTLREMGKRLVSDQEIMYGFLEASKLYPQKEGRSLP
ncbi:MAG: superendonuclease family protein [Chthonomonadaceae bacterium]|nr:superendonuclease family protein [Chthonomonadaceae bacterium]